MKQSLVNRFLLFALPSALFILFIIFVFHAIRFGVYDNTPIYWDYASHSNHTLGFYQDFFLNHSLHAFLRYDTYPPLFHWIFSLFIWAFGYSKSTIIMQNILLLMVLLITVFFYTKSIFNRRIAFLATLYAFGIIIFLLQPDYVFKPLFDFMLDFPLTVLTFISYCFLRYGFTRNRYSLRFTVITGTVIGLTFLTKWTAGTVLLIPILIYIRRTFQKKIYRAGVFLLLSSFFVCGWWYLLHLRELTSDFLLRTHDVRYFQTFPLSVYLHPPLSHYGLLLFIFLPFMLIILSTFQTYKQTGKNFIAERIRSPFIREYINIVISLIIFLLYPAGDFRFLYPTLFLLFMILLWNCLSYANGFALSVLSFCILVFTTVSLYLFTPFPSRHVYILDRLQQYITTHQTDSYGIFFEAPSVATFNETNVTDLMLTLEIFGEKKVNIRQINHFPDFYTCDDSYAAQTVIVYSFPDTASDTVPYTKTCPESFRHRYAYFATEKAYDGKLDFYILRQ